MIFEFLVQKMLKISVDHIYFGIGSPSIFTKHFIILTKLQKLAYVFSIYEIWKNICITAVADCLRYVTFFTKLF